MAKSVDQAAELDRLFRERSRSPAKRTTWKTRAGPATRMAYLRGSFNRSDVMRPITLPDRPFNWRED